MTPIPVAVNGFEHEKLKNNCERRERHTGTFIDVHKMSKIKAFLFGIPNFHQLRRMTRNRHDCTLLIREVMDGGALKCWGACVQHCGGGGGGQQHGKSLRVLHHHQPPALRCSE
jgi:hypothetical protein